MATKKKTEKIRSARKRLGRGLSSLISSPVEIEASIPVTRESSLPVGSIEDEKRGGSLSRAESHDSMAPAAGESAVVMLDLDHVQPRSDQPRQYFDEKALAELADSIRSAGLMQPVLVRPVPAGGYELIAGERRWRAMKLVGMSSIPAIIRDLDDEHCAEWSLIENLQREDLNPIERAEAFQHLIDTYSLTHQDVAQRVGLERSNVSNHLRLNDLDPVCKEALRTGQLSMGHAKVMLGITNITRREGILSRTLKEGWSVRELERRVQPSKAPSAGGRARTSIEVEPNPQLVALERRLGEHLGTKVRIMPGKKHGSGKLVIEYFDFDQFDGILQTFQFNPD